MNVNVYGYVNVNGNVNGNDIVPVLVHVPVHVSLNVYSEGESYFWLLPVIFPSEP